jgi:hypothetical protein
VPCAACGDLCTSFLPYKNGESEVEFKKKKHILVSVNDENKWMNSAMEKDVIQKISKKW